MLCIYVCDIWYILLYDWCIYGLHRILITCIGQNDSVGISRNVDYSCQLPTTVYLANTLNPG